MSDFHLDFGAPRFFPFFRDVHSLVFVNYLALAAVVTSPLLGFAFEETWLQRPSAWALALLFLLASLASLGETLLAVGLKMETAAKVGLGI